MIAARYASLIAFAQARAFCPNGTGNGITNTCGSKELSAPDKDSGGGSASFPDTWDTDSSRVVRQGPLPPGLEKLGSFKLGPNATPREVVKLSQEMGIKSPEQLVTIGACNVAGADVTINQLSSNALTARADVPAGDGHVEIDTTMLKGEEGPTIDYGLLDLDDTARKQAESDESFSRRVAGQMFDVMLSSMEAAEKAGFVSAETVAEGYGAGYTNGRKTALQGYRLWGRFGFDAKIPRRWFASVKEKGVDVHSVLNPLDRDQLNNEGSVRLQQLLATKQGENIWKKWGIALPLTFDFTNKASDGYLRYRKMLAASKRAPVKRDFFEYVAGLEMREDPDLWSGFTEQRAMGEGSNASGGAVVDCGRDDDGKFGSGNTCRVGINVNDEHQDFTGQILSGEKTIETRLTNSLKPYIGKHVGIIRTGKGKAMLVGTMKIGEPKHYKTAKEFDADYEKHRVAPDSPHYIGPEGKYGYPLSEVTKVKPVALPRGGIIARILHKSEREMTVEFDLGGESPEHPHVTSRAFCPTGEGNGIDNSCGAKTMSAPDKDSGGGSTKSVTVKKGVKPSQALSPKNKKSWLSPSGDFYPVALSDTHNFWAVRNTSAGKIPEAEYDDAPAGEHLFKNGWIRVAHASDELYLDTTSKRDPSGTQKKNAIDFAIHSGDINSVVLTNEGWIKKTLWRKTDDRSADCGRDDDGRFSSGNKCGGQVDMPKEDPRGRLRYDNGVQTDAARKLYQMGSSEKKLKSLVDAMGGDPKNTTVDMNHPGVDISVADKDGNKLFHVSFENGKASLYPAKDLSEDEIAKIKDAAEAAFGGSHADTSITVYGKASDIKKWHDENDAKHKAWEDKYKFSTLLPPHQRPKKWERSLDARHASLLAFAESRNCGQDADGKFSKGNTCAYGLAADVASNAAKGAAIGAASGFGRTFLPQAAATSAAVGAVAGIVKGIYDNKMRPTRVSARIEKVGLTDGKVADLVKGLGGTPKSLASTNGRSGLTLTIRGKNGKVSHVVDITDKKVSIYPVSGRRELTDDQIATIKKVATDVAPKETTVVVKTNSLSYASRLAKKGFSVAAKHAGVITATALVSAAAPSVPDAVLGVTDLVFDTHFTDSFYRKPNAKR